MGSRPSHLCVPRWPSGAFKIIGFTLTKKGDKGWNAFATVLAPPAFGKDLASGVQKADGPRATSTQQAGS